MISSFKVDTLGTTFPASILYKFLAGRYRPVSYPDGPITARYRFKKNAYWVDFFSANFYKGENFCDLYVYFSEKEVYRRRDFAPRVGEGACVWGGVGGG